MKENGCVCSDQPGEAAEHTGRQGTGGESVPREWVRGGERTGREARGQGAKPPHVSALTLGGGSDERCHGSSSGAPVREQHTGGQQARRPADTAASAGTASS